MITRSAKLGSYFHISETFALAYGLVFLALYWAFAPYTAYVFNPVVIGNLNIYLGIVLWDIDIFYNGVWYWVLCAVGCVLVYVYVLCFRTVVKSIGYKLTGESYDADSDYEQQDARSAAAAVATAAVFAPMSRRARATHKPTRQIIALSADQADVTAQACAMDDLFPANV